MKPPTFPDAVDANGGVLELSVTDMSWVWGTTDFGFSVSTDQSDVGSFPLVELTLISNM